MLVGAMLGVLFKNELFTMVEPFKLVDTGTVEPLVAVGRERRL